MLLALAAWRWRRAWSGRLLLAGRWLRRGLPKVLGARLLVLLALAVVLAGAVAWRYGLTDSWTRSRGRSPDVLVLALDGLDPRLLEQYMAEGKLPNFQRLAREGIYHPLPTVLPAQRGRPRASEP